MAPPSDSSAPLGSPPARTVRTGSTRRSFSRSYSSTADVASSQHNAAVVVEFGSAFIRVGLAGEPTPRHVVQAPDLPLPAAGRTEGRNLTEKKWEGILYPLMSQILTDQLLVKPRSRRVIIVEPFVSPTTFRTSLCRVLLHWMNVPCVLFASGGMVTVPYALGMNGGLVVDVGRLEGRVVCVNGGRYLTNTFQAVPCGFESLANALMEQHNSMAPDGAIPTLVDATSILQQCLESPFYGGGKRDSNIEFNIPSTDETGTITVGIVQDCLDDMLFNVSNPESLVHALLSSILSCPVDLRVEMLQNVSLVGGGAVAVPGFERMLLKSVFALFDPALESETLRGTAATFKCLSKAVTKQGPFGIISPLPYAPQLMSWIGGSIMGALGMSDERWVFRQSFMEQEELSKESGQNTAHGIHDFLAVSS